MTTILTYDLVVLLVFSLLPIQNCFQLGSSKNNCSVIRCDKASCMDGILKCTRPRSISSIPPPPTQSIHTLFLSDQSLPRQLTINNVGTYNKLNNMTIRNCGIQSIAADTLNHLIDLRYIDLSYNNIRQLEKRLFKFLNIKVLILTGNMHIKLLPGTFLGSTVNKLYLNKCSLNHIPTKAILTLNGMLETLDLSQNNLKIIDSRLMPLLSGTNTFKNFYIHDNPFNCTCQLRWLVETLRKLNQLSLKQPPRCQYPKELKGASLTVSTPLSYYCPKPKIEKIELKIITETLAELSCHSNKRVESRVKWLFKPYRNIESYKLRVDNEVTINVSRKLNAESYKCIIYNENGNSTLTIQIKWPTYNSTYSKLNHTKLYPSSPSSPSSSSNNYKTSINNPTNTPIFTNSNIGYLWMKQYTFLEMILAIAGTFLTTIITFILLFFYINYHRKRKSIRINKSAVLRGYEVGIYSDSQTYEIPQLSPYHDSNNGRLLDFKTQQEIRTDW